MQNLILLQAVTFTDIFKKSFLQGWTSQEISASSVFVTMMVTALIAIYVFFIYRLVSRKTFYSKNFNVSLAGVAIITSAIIITIQSSIVISLGMVGALSIVRFRTAVKNPMDLMFLFWAISIGIICGAGYAIYAVMLSVILTFGIFFLEWLPIAKAPSILVVNTTDMNAEDAVIRLVKKYSKHFTVKSHNATSKNQSFTIEIPSCQDQSALIKELTMTEGVSSASILLHDGEVSF